MKDKRINSLQVGILRRMLVVDALLSSSSSRPLESRGFIQQHGRIPSTTLQWFILTESGRARARLKADKHVVRDGQLDDPSWMEDLP